MPLSHIIVTGRENWERTGSKQGKRLEISKAKRGCRLQRGWDNGLRVRQGSLAVDWSRTQEILGTLGISNRHLH